MDQATEILPGTCPLCHKEFASRKLRNRHIKRVHKIAVTLSRKSNILCPLCEEKNENIITFENLRNHIEGNHKISIEKVQFNFPNLQEYEMWKGTERIETMYTSDRINQYKDHKELHYACNRSNLRGYQAKQCKRSEKAGGTIKIHGVCPSKLIIKIYNTEKIVVTYWKTHVGHDENELRSKRLSKTEKNMVVEKLRCGVPKARILEDVRKLETPVLERINLLSNSDVNYLARRKYNIEKKRDNNDMVAVALKVEEWNTNPNKKINAQREEFHKWIDNLNNEAFERFMRNIQCARKQEDEIANKEIKLCKRKMEKQEYFPTNKRRKE